MRRLRAPRGTQPRRERDAAQAAADTARQAAVEITERLRATRAELAAAEEPHDSETRLGRRLAAAGWSSLLDTIDAPEDSWAAVEAVVGGELEGALLWTGDDPRGELGGARGAARLLAGTAANGDAGRRTALDAVGAERTLADWTGAGEGAPLAFQRTVVARDVGALLDGWQGLPPGWSAVTPEGDLADGRGVIVLRGRADPPGGASARAHARRRELASAVGLMAEESSAAQANAHAATERLRAARDSHLAAREASEDADDVPASPSCGFGLGGDHAVEAGGAPHPARGGARAGAGRGCGPRASDARPPRRAPGDRGPRPDASATSARAFGIPRGRHGMRRAARRKVSKRGSRAGASSGRCAKPAWRS